MNFLPKTKTEPLGHYMCISCSGTGMEHIMLGFYRGTCGKCGGVGWLPERLSKETVESIEHMFRSERAAALKRLEDEEYARELGRARARREMEGLS